MTGIKILVSMLATIGLVWLITPGHLRSDNELVISNEVSNELMLEQYVYRDSSRPIVIAGSSITTTIPVPDCRPDDVATIPLQGRSALTGLEAIRRVGARPKVVFVEVPTITILQDDALLDTVFPTVYWRVRARVPPLRLTRNWLVLWFQRKEWEHAGFNPEIPGPTQTVDQWNTQFEARMAAVVKGGPPSLIMRALPQIKELIDAVRSRGARVIFFDPIDPRAKLVPPESEARQILRETFPDIPIIDSPDEEAPFYRYDGLHFHASSGLRFFDYMMQRANLAVTSKCRVPNTL